MHILVTGSLGFVGQNLVPHLVKNGIRVTGLDMKPGEDRGHIQYRLGSYQGLLLPDDIDVVVHLASQSHVDRSISGPLAFIDDNVKGTLELFEACKGRALQGKPLQKIVHFSTDEVGACLTTGELIEEYRFDCGSVYSASKGAQELLVQAYIKTFNLPIVTTRCVNIFGKFQADEKFLPTVCRKAMAGERIPIYGSGMQKRQWVHVDHVCEYINYVATMNYIPPKSLLHITGTKEYPNILIAHTVLSLLEKPYTLISHVADRLGHDERYALGRTAKTDDFGCPEYGEHTFMDDLAETVQWYKKMYTRVG